MLDASGQYDPQTDMSLDLFHQEKNKYADMVCL